MDENRHDQALAKTTTDERSVLVPAVVQLAVGSLRYKTERKGRQRNRPYQYGCQTEVSDGIRR